MQVISVDEMKRLDKEEIERGTASLELMERAGAGLVNYISRWFPSKLKGQFLVLVGKGNNGGDGLVIARELSERGKMVRVILVSEPGEMSKDGKTNFERLQKHNVEIVQISEYDMEEIKNVIVSSDVVVDAIFGTGFKGEIEGKIGELIEVVNNSGKFVVACDIPSGVNGSTGEASRISIRADLTVSFAFPKKGLVLNPGNQFVGRIGVVDIGISQDLREDKKINIITPSIIKSFLPKRDKDTQKKNYGHILVISGSPGMTGASSMVSQSAMRSGAGLITLGIPRSLNQILEMKLTEVMTLPLEETSEGYLALGSLSAISDFIEERKIDLLVVGSGLGRNSETRDLVREILVSLDIPKIIDADGINALEGHTDVLNKAKGDIVITPHPGEFSRVSGIPVGDIQGDRIGVASDFAKRYNVICVLKGYQTVVTDGETVYINPTGNPGMATAGTGDVLVGMIAGFFSTILNQERKNIDLLFDASLCGTFLHGLSGDWAEQEKGEISLIATDLIDKIPEAINSIQR